MQEHSFFPSPTDKSKCALCKRTYLDAHSALTSCEACGKVRKVILFGDADNPKAMLLCSECTKNEIDSAVRVALDTSIEVQNERVASMNETLARAHELDATIRYNGDFFNAKVLALEEIRISINSEETLSADEKQFKFQSYLADRIAGLKEVIFELDEKKHQAVVEEQVIRKSLREMEKDLRNDIRARIKETDSNYEVKQIKQVKPRIKKETVGTYDRLVQMFMTVHGCSKEDAIEAINKGSGGKFGSLPK